MSAALTACILSLASCSPHVAPSEVKPKPSQVAKAGPPDWLWYVVAGTLVVSAGVSVAFVVIESQEGRI